MPDPIYFQWQNEFLLQTIYPLRETKLRDFLVFTYEFDVWAQYKSLKAENLADEVKAYRTAQKTKVAEAYDSYQTLESYFMDEDVTDTYQASFAKLDPEIMVKINDLHKNFKRYFPSYQSPVKEKYFVSERVRQFEDMRKKISDQIAEKTRVLRNMGPTWGRKNAYEQQVALLSGTSIKMVNQELSQLYAFLAAYTRLESYRQELDKRRAQKTRERDVAERQFKAAQSEREALNPRLAQVQQALRRLTAPPDYDACRMYFLDTDVSDLYQQQFPVIEAALMLKINDMHKTFARYFPTYKNAIQETYFLNQRVKEMEDFQQRKTQELASKKRALQWMPANSPNRPSAEKAIELFISQTIRPLEHELEKLHDFQQANERRGKPASTFTGQIAQRKKEQAEIESQMRKVTENETAQTGNLQRLATALSVSPKEQLHGLIDERQVSVQDLVRERVENYKSDLAEKTHFQLLEAVIERFVKDPTRYPLWLQYMVVHFSGMRYQSAHGSWADPKDLLVALRSKAVDEELRRAGTEAIEAICEERYQIYQSGPASTSALDDELPALALTQDPEWREKIDYHLRGLNPASRGYYKPKVLLDLRIDEEEYEVQMMTDQQALEALESLKDQLPEWMWKEIVRLTDLRLKEVKDANWEQLSQADYEDRYAKEMAVYREILNKWKQAHITGWREEHDRANRLIVTRAVCNEVAEHIQHLRGMTPPGGLTAKPEWYLRNEKNPQLGGAAYLRKARNAVDFKIGASILWLRWVLKEPNAWQIARPIALANGEELIPSLRDTNNIIQNTGSGYRRTITYQLPDKTQRQDTQWLRWMHEATVVEAGETVDGPTILTFETALPYEDRRQSTIGVFKHPAAWLSYNVSASVMNGVFVGFVPEGELPYDDLKEMLDWNKILLRNAYNADQIKHYWEQVTLPPAQPVSFAAEAFGIVKTQVEIAPQLSLELPHEWAMCYEIDSRNQHAVPYEPAVALRRGMRLTISSSEAETVGEETYYKVTDCAAEPRAETLYVRGSETIEAPEPGSSRPVQARKDIPLYKICRVTRKMHPVLEAVETSVTAGTRLRISTVHAVGPSDAEDGAIQASGRAQYYLVSECPRISSAEGLFVRKSDVRAISEKNYQRNALDL